jgi:hypothetical protein
VLKYQFPIYLCPISPLSVSPLPSCSLTMIEIDLDKAIPYQPPVPLPHKPSQHATYTPCPSGNIPSLAHPLPQRPISPTIVSKWPSQLHQERQGTVPPSLSQPGPPTNVNLFDRELAALDTIADRNNALERGLNCEEEQPHTGVGDTLKQDSIMSRNGKWTLRLPFLFLTAIVKFRIGDRIVSTTDDLYNNRGSEFLSSASHDGERRLDASLQTAPPKRPSPVRVEHENISETDGLGVSMGCYPVRSRSIFNYRYLSLITGKCRYAGHRKWAPDSTRQSVR